MTTAFVLTGGGSLGAVQVGMARALRDAHIRPDLLIGTSIGAANAAYLAGPGDYGERVDALAWLWRAIRRKDMFVVHSLRFAAAGLGGEPSLFSAAPFGQLLVRELGYEDLSDAQIPVRVVVTDLMSGVVESWGSGDAVSSVLASAAVPGLLPPVVRHGRTFVDGAIGRGGSLAEADALGVDDIYVLPSGYACANRTPPHGALAILLTSVVLLLHGRLLDELSSYAGSARLHVLPPPCPMEVSPADFSHAGELIDRGRDSVKEWLETRRPVGAADIEVHSHAESVQR